VFGADGGCAGQAMTDSPVCRNSRSLLGTGPGGRPARPVPPVAIVRVVEVMEQPWAHSALSATTGILPAGSHNLIRLYDREVELRQLRYFVAVAVARRSADRVIDNGMGILGVNART
jgi:hypothetical protein